MEWTYLTYTIADYGISIGLILGCLIGVFVTFFSSKTGREFVTERVIGVNPTKAHDDYDQFDLEQYNAEIYTKSHQKFSNIKQKSIFYIGIFCCLLGGMTLSITAVLMFQGCFLGNDRILPGDDCPEFKSDCFQFGESALVPLTNNVSFVCRPSDKAEFTTNISDATAWCYGWIIAEQTTKSVLDQLGVAIALIGFFTTLLAAFIYLGRCKKTIGLSIVFIVTCSVAIIVLLVLKWTFAPLTYAILALGVLLGIFGLVLYAILPTPQQLKDKKQIFKMDINKPSAITTSAVYYNKQPRSMATSPSHVKTTYQPSNVILK
ncbi:unnamed protein product [Adineta steineri]|uniref:Uncharacterized protein n=1 Tax=Adineta steineri TaxID=433720 RepID=A0A815R5X0_9BILA|nr:unnamed protein product [Adineta steineri]CAF1472625.1 unnamed protein product [Adineta steineri]CAF3505086.1 unnamed protein product [Adineta steineri]